MNSVNASLRDRILLRTHYLSRFETTQYRSLLETLQQAHDSVVAKIATTGGKGTKEWLDQVLVDLDGIYSEAFKAMGKDLTGAMKGLSKVESEWAASTMEDTIPLNVTVTSPSPAQVWAAVTTSPADRGHLLSELVDGFERGTVDKITAAVRQGVVEGETIDDMVRRIRGTVVTAEGYVDAKTGNRIVGKTTAAMKKLVASGAARKVPGVYQGGAMETSTRTAEALARTAVMHVSNVARNQVAKENADLLDGEQFVATLDTRTCDHCGPEDGKIFPVGEGPTPPLHINCRCLRIPVVKSWKDLGFNIDEVPPGWRASMDGPVENSPTYEQWMRSQPESVQNEALGVAKAQLFRDGMSLSKFFADGRTITLEELGVAGKQPSKLSAGDVSSEIKVGQTNREYQDWLAKYDGTFVEVDDRIFAPARVKDRGNDFEPNLVVAKKLVSSGWQRVAILPDASTHGAKNVPSPDLNADGELFDVKTSKSTSDGTLHDHMKKARQQAGRVIFDYAGSESQFPEFLRRVRYRAGRMDSLEVWVIGPDQTPTKL